MKARVRLHPTIMRFGVVAALGRRSCRCRIPRLARPVWRPRPAGRGRSGLRSKPKVECSRCSRAARPLCDRPLGPCSPSARLPSPASHAELPSTCHDTPRALRREARMRQTEAPRKTASAYDPGKDAPPRDQPRCTVACPIRLCLACHRFQQARPHRYHDRVIRMPYAPPALRCLACLHSSEISANRPDTRARRTART